MFKADKTRGDNQDIMNKLRIAISRFPVSEDIERNEMFIKKYIVCAAQHEADIVYFPETA